MLTKNGLTEDTVCVDYGCGTLRIGVHVIEHLGRGAYWGFDIDEAFLDKGRELIGAQTYIEKAPHLRVVSPASVAEESFADGLLEYPQFTKPPVFEGLSIPDVLLSGDHGKVAAWRRAEAERITRERRPDLWQAYAARRSKHS